MKIYVSICYPIWKYKCSVINSHIVRCSSNSKLLFLICDAIRLDLKQRSTWSINFYRTIKMIKLNENGSH